ncbi:MAG: hypothetical protein IT181_21185 [Acidobacteria bacterium]|nr:hypothetical protein [Acidobacteriota bacterium]
MTARVLYTAENEYPPAEVGAFLEWYAYRHAPDILRLGFQSCATYRAVEGGFNLLGIYELASLAIFESPGYRNMQPRDPYRAGVAARTLKRAHTVYVQRALHPVEVAAELPALDTDWLAMLRFDATAAVEDDIIGWFGAAQGPRLLGLGAKRLRIAHREGERPNSVTSRPRCLIVGEWSCRPPAGAEIWRELLAHFGSALQAVEYYAGRRAYPWPDDGGAAT